MLELLSSEDYSKKVPSSTAVAPLSLPSVSSSTAPLSLEPPTTNHRKIVILNGLDTPYSSGQWDETPEDLALTASRFSIILERLALENAFLTVSLRLPHHLSLCHRLLALSLQYQGQSLALASGKGVKEEEEREGAEQDEEFILHRCALLDLLANASLAYTLALVAHLKPIVPSTMPSKIIHLQSRARGRLFSGNSPDSSLMTDSQYEELAVKYLQSTICICPIPPKIFQIFAHSLLTFAALSPESLRSILAKIFRSGATTRLLSVLRLLSRPPLHLPSHELHCLRRASHLILHWITDRYRIPSSLPR